MNEKLKYNKKIMLIIKITAVLMLIQLARASINKVLHTFLGQIPALTGSIFIFIGIILYFIFKPDAKSLALSIGDNILSIILLLIESAVLIPIF